MVENRKSGRLTSVMYSKSCQLRMKVVAAIPAAANANPVSTAAGRASAAQYDLARPIARMTTMNAIAYRAPRISAQPISPSATSPARIGVASVAL